MRDLHGMPPRLDPWLDYAVPCHLHTRRTVEHARAHPPTVSPTGSPQTKAVDVSLHP
jgi:hypothetical protein